MTSRYYLLGEGRDNVPFNTVQEWEDQTLSIDVPRQEFYKRLLEKLNTLRTKNANFTVLGMYRVRKHQGWLDFIRVEGTVNNILRRTLNICVLLPDDPRPDSLADPSVNILYTYTAPDRNERVHAGGHLHTFKNYINLYFPPPDPDQLAGIDISDQLAGINPVQKSLQWQLDKIKYIASRL